MNSFDCEICEDSGCDECDDSFHFQATWNMIKRLADQISHPSLAVGELIKNAYDADATEVLVNMKKSMDENLDNCSIVIHDDGHGMTKKDIKTKWSNMGVSANEGNPFSPGGRSKQGGFGLGRFGGWKLGKKVTIATRAKDNPVYALIIDFSEYPTDTALEKVMTPIMTNPQAFRNLFPDGKTGTYIIVEKFNNSMTSYTDLQKIQRATQTLLNPFEKDGGFKIILQLPKKFERWEDFSIEKVIDQALYRYEVSIDARGQTIQGTYKDNNPYSKHYGEEKILNYKTDEILREKCQIKAVKVWIYHFHRGAGYKRLWPKTSYGSLSKDDYNKRLAGFRLYKDSVRVWPYGELGNDWLELDFMQNKERSASWFSNTQIVAAARFDMTANQGIISDKTSRDGLEDSIGERQLKEVLRTLVKRMRALVNRSYPDKMPPHLENVSIEYGNFTHEIGDNLNISPRSLGGDITTAFKIIKGKKPKWLKFDSDTGSFSGIANKVEDIKLTITVGNSQGSDSSDISINIIEKQKSPPIDRVEGEFIIQDSINEGSVQEGRISNISDLDKAISGFRMDIIKLQEERNSKTKMELLMKLNASIRKLIDEIKD